jgi:hypothetical protein
VSRGDSFSVDELITSKESALEVRLWEAVYAFEEMAALLKDLDRLHLADRIGSAACQTRIGSAGEHAIRLRSVIQADRPVIPRESAGRPAGPVPP